MVKKVGILGILVFLFWGHSFAAVKVVSELHRTEWNWVEYRLHLLNGSESSLINPEVRYFAQNSWLEFCENKQDAVCEKVRYGIVPADSMLTATVDYVSFPFSTAVSTVSNSEFTTFKIRISGIIPPDDSIQIHFRIHRKDWAGWSDEKSFSHQKDAGIFEPNFFISVYSMGGQLLWGVDPVNGKWSADEIWWDFRGKRSVIEKFGGEEESVSGRFWLLKENPLTGKERRLLAEIGVERLNAGPYQGLDLILFKARNPVSKTTLNKIVSGFYNAFDADDTTAVKLKLSAKDLGKDTLKLQVGCWRDVPMSECRNLVEICDGKDARIDRTVVLSDFLLNRIECLERNRDIYRLDVIYEGSPTNNFGRKAVRISGLQNDSVWKAELKKSKPSLEWLQNADYTGEGIIAGVYDKGIDFKHPSFLEDSMGILVPRKAPAKKSSSDSKSDHGTHVAGILGGNGSASEGYRYRGVAPKVRIFSDGGHFFSQIGHVVNHSHIWIENSLEENSSEFNYYGTKNQNADRWIFNDWKDFSDYGDSLSKLVVFAAGNNGVVRQDAGYTYQIGYHSILVDAKNPITVGNYASVTGIRNTNSSMGPTWDGRIKPDVMAPGSTVQYSFDSSNPFTVYIDYVKFYHKDSLKPFFVLDFSSFVQPSAEMNISTLEVVQDKDALNGFALKYSDFRPDAGESYINWKLSDWGLDSLKVNRDDIIEFRLRTETKNLERPRLGGTVYFCPAEDFNKKNKWNYERRFIEVIWPLSKEYSLARFVWKQSLRPTRFFRFGFAYDQGILSSVPCSEVSEENCYAEDSGTSMAAPFVSGIGALIYQRFAQKTGKPLTQESMRNSTAKAILIHTAEDMIDTVGFARDLVKDIFYTENDGQSHLVKLGKGPDFATGWGKVNGEKALNVLEDFNEKRRTFNRFREFGIENGKEAHWNMAVPVGKENLRVTLAWDDCAGIDGLYTATNFSASKLCNDLDLYLISPSGKFYFPWRIDPLPIEKIDLSGNAVPWSSDTFGIERIKESDMPKAKRYCGKNDAVRDECFDHLNNVEVVDVDNPEQGTWQVVVRGTAVREGNVNGDAQLASIVSDFTLTESSCQIMHPYKAQNHLECEYALGDNLEAFVTFDEKTFVGGGDTITLSDDSGKILGKYAGNALAGKRIRMKSSKLKVELESDNDSSQGYGFEIRRIEKVPFSIAPLFLPAIKSRRR